jgi:hypothetical protein
LFPSLESLQMDQNGVDLGCRCFFGLSTLFFFVFFNYFNVKNKILKINKIFKIFPAKKHFQKSKTIYIIISNIHLTWCLILWYVLHMWF